MQTFEYKVVPAPKKGEKVRGAKTTQERFAQTLTALMNELGSDGWEYLRADTLPCEERVGLTGRTTVFQNMLVFRRALTQPEQPAAPVSRPISTPTDALRRMPDFGALTARRKLSTDAPTGEAPRISLVQALPETVGATGPAPGNGIAKP